MSDSMSPYSICSTGSESMKKTVFPFNDNCGFMSDDGLAHRSKHCKFCRAPLLKINSNWLKSDSWKRQSREITDGCQSKLYTISASIFGLFCSEAVDHVIQLRNILSAISQIKKSKLNVKIKIFCLTNVCQEVARYCDEYLTVAIDLYKLPHLAPMVKFCENLYDWLSSGDRNIAFIYCNKDESLIFAMCYTFSCHCDAMLRLGRDLQQSSAINSFLKLHSKSLEKVPVSYRRYAGYMCSKSSLKPPLGYRSSVNLHCLILYNFPSMEANKHKSSQLFFKIYTDEPLRCSHTTKLYCLPSNVNRLVILFDLCPVLLRNDTMIICYHRSVFGTQRTKILRLNFHTCQATDDRLSFYSHDFEDLYPACPFKMKLDLYFQATAVLGQEEDSKYRLNSSMSCLSELERFDSYQSLAIAPRARAHSSMSTTSNLSSSITIFRTNIYGHKFDERNRERNSITLSPKVINNSGRITGPVDSHHSTKLESVRTSSTVLNGLEPGFYDMPRGQHLSSFSDNYRCDRSQEGEKCSQQLDTLMRDLNLNTTDSVASTTHNYSYNRNGTMQNNIQGGVSNNREVQLMSELLEAQKEISNLRRSMNNLDMIDHSRSGNQAFKRNLFTHRSQSLAKDMSDTQSMDYSRPRMWTSNQRDILNSNIQRDCTLPSSNQFLQQGHQKPDFHSLDGRATASGYSAHRENMERERTMKEKYLTVEKETNHKYHNDSESNDVLEEIETINLQPIGKGIQDLNKGNSPMKFPRTITPAGSYRLDRGSHGFIDNIGSMSPPPMKQNFSMSKSNFGSVNRIQNDMFSPGPMSPIGFLNGHQQDITLQVVEDRSQWWYQPNISRDEAIVILKNCNPGSFLIRDSNTYNGAYGLAVKVASIPPKIMPKSDDLEAEKVRHYLIESMGNQGVCFKGFPEEPVFSSLPTLVLYYTHTVSVLPCVLVLPERPLHETPRLTMKITGDNSVLISSPKIPTPYSANKNGYSVYYLGCFDVEYITGPSVINKAIERLLADLDARKFTECQLRINPGDGIVLTDMERKLFFRRHHVFANISYCALDPRDRKIELELCKSNGIKKTKLFGIIIKNYVAGENKCFLFGELNPAQKASDIVKDIIANLQKPMQM